MGQYLFATLRVLRRVDHGGESGTFVLHPPRESSETVGLCRRSAADMGHGRGRVRWFAPVEAAEVLERAVARVESPLTVSKGFDG